MPLRIDHLHLHPQPAETIARPIYAAVPM